MKVYYKNGVFTDYTGTTRPFIAAAVVEDYKESPANKGDLLCTRSIKIGFAICSPEDEYDETVGRKIASDKAINSKFITLSTYTAALNDFSVIKILDETVIRFIAHPEEFIATYSKDKTAYLREQEILHNINKLPKDKLDLVHNLANLSDDELEDILDAADYIRFN